MGNWRIPSIFHNYRADDAFDTLDFRTLLNQCEEISMAKPLKNIPTSGEFSLKPPLGNVKNNQNPYIPWCLQQNKPKTLTFEQFTFVHVCCWLSCTVKLVKPWTKEHEKRTGPRGAARRPLNSWASWPRSFLRCENGVSHVSPSVSWIYVSSFWRATRDQQVAKPFGQIRCCGWCQSRSMKVPKFGTPILKKNMEGRWTFERPIEPR